MADAYNKDEMNRRMNGAVATAEERIRRPAHRPGQRRAARSRHGRGLWQLVPDQPGGHHHHPRAAHDHGAGVGQEPGQGGGQGDPRRRPRPQSADGRPVAAHPAARTQRGAAQGTVQARLTNMPSTRGSPCAMCAATAWKLLKKLEKDHKIGQDEHRTIGDELQKLTDAHIRISINALHSKEQEIMQV